MTDIEPTTTRPPLKADERGGWDLEVQLAELDKPLDWNALFGRPGAVEVEIGCGSGLYIASAAQLRPETNFFGIEYEGSQVKRSKDKWRRRELLNTRIIRCDALYFLEDYPAAESIDIVTVLFPDPWFKKRHHKRRIFQLRFMDCLKRTLKPGGKLYIKTDVTAYYDVMAEVLAGADFLKKLYDNRLDQEPDPDDIPTNYQYKALEKGHPIHAMGFEKKPLPR